jgi:hypothetical protein
MTKAVVFVFCAIASFFALVLCGSGQEINGSIRGTVTDPSGAVVPRAEVKATNQATRVTTTVPTENDGSFAFLHLPVGTYDVTIRKEGFQTFTARDVILTLDAIYDLPVKLDLGQSTQTLEVKANPVQVETATTQLGTIIEARQIVDLPLNGRNWIELQQLAPGVVSFSDRTGAYATNGSQTQQNSFLVNGMDANDLSLNTPLVIPSPDAIEEFNLVASSINPEYGRNSGGVLNAIMKSGTNQFHGSAFEFYRDTFLDSHNFFQVAKPRYHQNQFGGTMGGPIVRDHTFFLFSYQGTRYVAPQGGGQTAVFSQDQRNGYHDISLSADRRNRSHLCRRHFLQSDVPHGSYPHRRFQFRFQEFAELRAAPQLPWKSVFV